MRNKTPKKAGKKTPTNRNASLQRRRAKIRAIKPGKRERDSAKFVALNKTVSPPNVSLL